MMSSKEEDTLRFFQYVEDSGLRAYNGLVSQNLDHARNERNKIHLQEKNDKKRKQEEAKKRTGDEVVTEGKHLRMGSLTMPAPPERMPVPPYLVSGPGFAVRSQSLHSVGGGSNGGGEEEVGSPTSRKQPPPKPRRDPATKLSISSETVDYSPTAVCRGCRANPDSCDAPQGCGDDCKRVPPPKPRRNPSTQLSTSFDESYIRKHNRSSKCQSPPSERERNASPPSDDSPSHHSDSDEPVYIEMGASVGGQTEAPRREDDEPGESVYEEMKYPLLDDMEYRWDPPGCRSACPTPAPLDPESLSRCSTPRNIPLCDIPAPFPNLLTHRPPLLVFPPAPAQCSPNSDESPLTPLDALAKLPMMDNPGAYSKSPTSSSEPPVAHLRRELTATPTLTVSGRSSAPPLPCTLYKSSAAHGYQRSHSACPSPVSMGRCLTPLSLMRTPPFDTPAPFPGGLPRSASATPHGKGSPPQDSVAGGRLHGSMQNVSTGRSRTPTSPLDELTNLFTAGRNMMKKNASGRKSKEPGETETSKNKSHSESRRDGKERHGHSKESKRDGKERSKESSSHRRDTKDRGGSTAEPPPRRNSKDRGCSSVEPLPMKRDSRERGCSSVEPVLMRRDSKDKGIIEPPPVRRDSKGRGCNSMERMPRRDSKDKSVPGMDPLLQSDGKDSPWDGEARHDSKERLSHQNPPELLPRQDSKDRTRNAMDSRHDSRDRTDSPPELLPRQSNKESPRNGLECRRDSKDRDKVSHGSESRHEGKERNYNGVEPLSRQDFKESVKNDLEARRDSKDRSCSASELPPRRDSYGVDPRRDHKDRAGHSSEALTRRDSRDRGSYSTEQSKAQERNGVSGQQSSTATPTRHGRPTGSPPLVLGTATTELKPTLQKYGRSSSAPVTPSPLGTPQRQAPEPQIPQMPWMCGDSTMLEQIERKRTLCMEIRSRQRPPERNPPERNPADRNLCKQDSMPSLPTWGKSNVAKKIRPPPYPSQTTVFWDTAI